MNFTLDLLLIPLAYLIGSISFAVVVSRCMNLPSPHSYGSGNPGATNVLRTGNKKAAVLTLIGDALKGYLAVMLSRMILGDQSLTATLGSWVLCGVVIAVFLGHCLKTSVILSGWLQFSSFSPEIIPGSDLICSKVKTSPVSSSVILYQVNFVDKNALPVSRASKWCLASTLDS